MKHIDESILEEMRLDVITGLQYFIGQLENKNYPPELNEARLSGIADSLEILSERIDKELKTARTNRPASTENELKFIKLPRVVEPTPPPVLTAKPVQPSPALKQALGQAGQPPRQSAANEHRLKPGKL